MNKIKYLLMAAVALLAVACEESNADYRDVVYITGTQQKNTIRKGFEGNDCVELSLTCTAKVTEEIKGTFEAAPELLTAYNEANQCVQHRGCPGGHPSRSLCVYRGQTDDCRPHPV